jgi:hypothetical protein
MKYAPGLKCRAARQVKAFKKAPSEFGDECFEFGGGETSSVLSCDVGDMQQVRVYLAHVDRHAV